MHRRVNLYIAISLDGYIAKTDNNIDFLSIVETPNEDYGYSDFIKNVDTIIWGRKTFDKVLTLGNGIPHKDKSVYVISRNRTGSEGHAVYNRDVVKLLKELQLQPGKEIYCDGGAEIAFELLKNRLIDRIIISVIPHLLGDGIMLFRNGRPEENLKFLKSVSYPSGLVQMWYDVENTQ